MGIFRGGGNMGKEAGDEGGDEGSDKRGVGIGEEGNI